MLISATSLRIERIDRSRLTEWTKEVQFGIESVLKKCPDDWTPPDVWASLYAGRSLLFVMFDESGYNGFFVLEPGQNHFNGKPEVNIWLLYSKKLRLEQLASQIREICKGADSVRFFSPRRWERRLRGLMHPKMTIFEAKL